MLSYSSSQHAPIPKCGARPHCYIKTLYRMCVKNFSKWAADPAQIQASAATAGSWNEPCTMFEALVDNPDPVFIT